MTITIKRGALRARLSPELAVGLAAVTVLLPGPAVWAQTVQNSPDKTPAGQGASNADAASPAPPQAFAIHGQFDITEQGNFAFRSPYAGPNSLDGGGEVRETTDATLFVGVRPWAGGELWANPEIDQGFGLSDTLGLAGYSNAQGAKVGQAAPYFKLQRLFFRQTIDLGGSRQAVDAQANQLAGSQTDDRLVLTLGKFSVVDVFDANDYAHDPRADFLNWSIVDTGSFDYAADAWGYTIGAAAEWYVGRWALRGGVFNLSAVPNGAALEYDFDEYQLDGELEERHQWAGHAGKVVVTWYLTQGRMARFADAIALGEATGAPADVSKVRRFRGRQGFSVNLQQELTDSLGVFVRGGIADGSLEPYEYTDIDRTIVVGLSLKGSKWSRGDDTVGLAAVVNGISKVHEEYLNDGGLGILVGDGKLPHPGPEAIVESYYSWAAVKGAHLAFDYQFVENPAYNRDRGPVSILSVRLHAAF
ncbi:MAG: carbohydrate porin [Caulobacteraceae bacterium]|nr:carbohydrate porin [Caulobacteraceae bacterium]